MIIHFTSSLPSGERFDLGASESTSRMSNNHRLIPTALRMQTDKSESGTYPRCTTYLSYHSQIAWSLLVEQLSEKSFNIIYPLSMDT